MDSQNTETTPKQLPFNNLFLNAGFVHGENKWYMYISTLSFTVLCYLLAPSITSIHLILAAVRQNLSMETIKNDPNLLFDYQWLGVDRNLILIALFGIFVVAFLGFRFALRKFHHKNLLSVLTAYDAFRYKRFFFAFMAWALVIVVSTMIENYMFPEQYKLNVDIQGLLISILLMAIFMPIQSGFEEAVFRGYLLQGFSLWFKNAWFPLLITSLLFGMAHMSNPEVEEYGWPTMLSYYFLFALFMGAITLLDEGLELAMGVHLANNMVASIMVCSDHSVIKTYAVFNQSGGQPLFELLLWFVFAAIVFFVFKKKYGWNNFNLILR